MLAFASSGPTCTLYNRFNGFQQKFEPAVNQEVSNRFNLLLNKNPVFHFDKLVKMIQVQGQCIFRKLHKMTVVLEFWILIYVS